jgi:hypothetical protein
MFTKERTWQFIEFFVQNDEMNEIVQKLNIAKKNIVKNDDLLINFEELF